MILCHGQGTHNVHSELVERISDGSSNLMLSYMGLLFACMMASATRLTGLTNFVCFRPGQIEFLSILYLVLLTPACLAIEVEWDNLMISSLISLLVLFEAFFV